MSASRERKKRIEQEQAPASKQKKSRKLSEGWILAISVILILAIVLGGILIYRGNQYNRVVMKVGSHEVRIPEFNYFYVNQASQISGYAAYMGIDTTVPLDQQYITEDGVSMLALLGIDDSYLDGRTATDGTYDVTWAQLLAFSTRETIARAYTIYDAAQTAGFSLDETERAELEEEIETLKTSAKTNGESVGALISRVYGRGCNLDGYRRYMELVHIAQYYPAEITYSADELSARYAESPEDFDVASFYVYSVAPSAFAETLEDGTKAETTDENTAQAKEAAEAMEKEFDEDFSGEQGTVTLYADYTREALTSYCGEEAANWIFDTAEPDAVKLFENNETFYVLKFLDKENYATVNALELRIEDDPETLAEGEQTAEEKRNDVKTSLEADPTEQTFRTLLERYPLEGSDGVVSNMTRSTMRNVSKDIFNWAGMETREVGDWETFEVGSGTLTLFFTGYGDTYRDTAVTATLTSEWVDEATNTALASCNYDESAAMDGSVGLVFSGAA